NPRIHVLLPAGRHENDPPTGVVAHRTRHLSDVDVIRSGLPRTMAARSLVDAARWTANEDDARAIIAAGFQQRLVGGGDHPRVLDRLSPVRRGALIARTAADAAGGSHSLAELDYLSLTRRAGLPEPSRQHVRQDATGRRRYLDVWYDEYRVHVEIDGGHHLEVRAAWGDMTRQTELWVAVARVLRVPAWLVRTQPATVVKQVRAALEAGGWQAAPRS